MKRKEIKKKKIQFNKVWFASLLALVCSGEDKEEENTSLIVWEDKICDNQEELE